jgi:hypothetical protein
MRWFSRVLATLAVAGTLALGGCGAKAPAPPEDDLSPPPVPARARFAQAALFQQTLLVIGQERQAIDDYVAALGAPAGIMIYTDLAGQGGLVTPFGGEGGCLDPGVHDMQHFIGSASPRLPRAIVQLGLALPGTQLADAADGRLDASIRQLAATLRATGHPVLMRPGYEAEGPWNAYDPATYQRAFRRIVCIFRGNEVGGQRIAPVENVSFVWHLAADVGALSSYRSGEFFPFVAWYPGDGYVDWIGISWFGYVGAEGIESRNETARDVVAEFARAHGKTLIIAESAPRDFTPIHGFDSHKPTSLHSWPLWYAKVLDWIEANDVRVWSYINQDWRAFPMFAGGCGNGGDIWGDSRVQQPDSVVLAPWKERITPGAPGRPLVSDHPDLWAQIGFAP